MTCDAPNEAVEVPPEVVPWKYIEPPLPPDAVIVVLLQNAPAPLTETAAGADMTEKFAAAMQPVASV